MPNAMLYGEKHEASTCRFKEVQCFKSGKRGHLAKVRRSASSGKTSKGTAHSGKRGNKQPWGAKPKEEKKEQPTHLVEDISE